MSFYISLCGHDLNMLHRALILGLFFYSSVYTEGSILFTRFIRYSNFVPDNPGNPRINAHSKSDFTSKANFIIREVWKVGKKLFKRQKSQEYKSTVYSPQHHAVMRSRVGNQFGAWTWEHAVYKGGKSPGILNSLHRSASARFDKVLE